MELMLICSFRYMGIGLSAQGVNMNRLPGTVVSFMIISIMYSRTSHKQQPKISSLGGRLQGVVARKSFNHNGSKFCHSVLW